MPQPINASGRSMGIRLLKKVQRKLAKHEVRVQGHWTAAFGRSYCGGPLVKSMRRKHASSGCFATSTHARSKRPSKQIVLPSALRPLRGPIDYEKRGDVMRMSFSHPLAQTLPQIQLGVRGTPTLEGSKDSDVAHTRASSRGC